MMNGQPIAIAADRELSATLQAQEWQLVLTGLRELPYRISAPLITKLEAALNAAAEIPVGVRPNGQADDELRQ